MLLVMVVGCSNHSDALLDPPNQATVAMKSPVPVDAFQRATVELPANGFNISAVLGADRKSVDKLLGHSEVMDDGGVMYDAFDKVALVVTFEYAKAALVTITANGYHDTDADRAAVFAWVHAPKDIDVDKTYAGAKDANFQIGLWLPGAQARQEERRAIAHNVNAFVRANNPAATVSASRTRLTVSPAVDDKTCDQRSLATLRDGLKSINVDLEKSGFEAMECLDDRGAVLKLR